MHTHDLNKLEVFKSQMPLEEDVELFANFFKAIGNSTRTKILLVLFELKELCQHEICFLLDMEKSAISHQMKILATNKLVVATKVGKEVFYRLHDQHVEHLISTTKEHLNEKRSK